MIRIDELIKKHSQFLKFCIVGMCNTFISVIVFNVLIYFGVHYLVATVIGYLAGLVNGYVYSSKFVFKKAVMLNTAVKFVLVYISALLINVVFMYVMVDMAKINPSVGQLIVTVFNVFYNFILNKMWTFKGK